MSKKERNQHKSRDIMLTCAFAVAASTVLADAIIHPGGVSDPANRQLFPEFIRDYLGNSAPSAILISPAIMAYACLKSLEVGKADRLANFMLRLALSVALIAQFDIENVTSLDVDNPQSLPDIVVGTATDISMLIAAKGTIDILGSHPQVVDFGQTDRLFDQPTMFHPPLHTNVDQIFG